ncbi:stress-activated map kinase interacting protein 1-domain-containing protein [Ephemerocybe angulata]|uniref:Stress-activated map kinase interacting protein 1-domain-containing protein n=1 Tax=Ephemerocybe angulata TaxID=980116 RepID=A0A8H6I4H8_9AGAR|nr:stress-activated map kinase interacting protein 1-domain-containing protein [Tulosesus angulatus]
MSLISDTDYLIHQLRLSYLRDVEDLYGPRIITLDQAYQANPYILASGLADQERWPELNVPSSPQLSEDEEGTENASGFPGARLKYTQTIMGGKSGGLGLRVHGKRMSTSKRMSYLQRKAAETLEESTPATKVSNLVSTGAPPTQQGTLSTSAPPVASSMVKPGDGWVKVDRDGDKGPDSPAVNVQIQLATAPEEAPVTKVVQFVPKFSKEVEARRQMRMAARRGPGASTHSSEEEEEEEEEEGEGSGDSSEESFGEEDAGDSSMDEGDEFDPEFAATRTGDSASDVNSIMSGNSSMPDSASHPHQYRTRPQHHKRRATSRTRPAELALVPGPRSESDIPQSKKSGNTMARTRPVSESMFARKKPPPAKPQKSALSSMMALSSGSSNPFSEVYAAISGRGQSLSTTINVFFPHATRPVGKPMELTIRKDATVEEVVGFALWSYWEEDWQPRLDEGLGEDDPRRDHKLSAVGWVLRIAEDDGEPDDDFPPPDRMGKISKFNSDAYAILEATPSQMAQNEILESKIQRRPSRTMTSKKPEKLTVPAAGAAIPSQPSALPASYAASTLSSVPLSTSLGPSSSHGPQIFLRIRVEDNADEVHILTTIPVSAGMYLQEALEMVCRRRKGLNPKDYALVLKLRESHIQVPLDRTVASLQGNRELLLIQKDRLHKLGNLSKEIRTTDPNASIFKHMSETPEQQYSSVLDYTAAYKKYNVYRKIPMLVTRQERILAIDGVYIHIMPSANKAKAVFDHGKTASYHIKSIADCQQSQKSSAFKLVLNRASGNKRYDFEAESPKLAAELVHTIRSLKAALERSGTVNRSRRSRQVV